MSLAFTVAIAAAAQAAEVVAAEVEGDVNAVTVEQGGSTSFPISVTATGTIRCGVTEASPATATFPTEVAIDDAGALTQGAPSAPLTFWANGFCRVTWPGAQAPQVVTATVSASAHAPLGVHSMRLRATTVTPPGTGERLLDQSNPFVTITVVEGSDVTPPVVSCGGPHGTAGDNGWYTSDVTHDCTASDDGSGLADAADGAFTLSTSGEGSVSTDARTVADGRGNASSAGAFGPYDVDLADPTIDLSSPSDGATYLLGSSHAVAYSCEDSASGVAFCAAGVLDTSDVGWKSVAVTARDVAGRASSVTHAYHVVYDYGGVSFPGGGAPKAGSTLPLSWSLNGVGDLGAIQGMTVAPCGGGADEATATPGSSDLRYDAEHDRYRVNWKTSKSWAGACLTLTLALGDGTARNTEVTFR